MPADGEPGLLAGMFGYAVNLPFRFGRKADVLGSPALDAGDVVVVPGEPLCHLVSGIAGAIVDSLQDIGRRQNTQRPIQRRNGDSGE